jgi:hypothetical protein
MICLTTLSGATACSGELPVVKRQLYLYYADFANLEIIFYPAGRKGLRALQDHVKVSVQDRVMLLDHVVT